MLKIFSRTSCVDRHNMVKPKGSVWSYFKVEDAKKVKCVFCHTVCYKNATRLEKHLKKCFKSPSFVKIQFTKADGGLEFKSGKSGAGVAGGGK